MSWKFILICIPVSKDMYGQTTFSSINADVCVYVCTYQNKVKPVYMH